MTSTAVTYVAAIIIHETQDARRKKLCLIFSIVVNLGILFLFKYYNFAASNVEALLHWSGLGIDIPKFGLLLPVGISFFTFHALG